jgi:purine-binding chemotaxis protein CheW
VTGLLVDRVSDVLEISPEEIQPSPQLGLGNTTPFVRGLIRHQEGDQERFLLVLDVDRVFAVLGSLHGGGGPGQTGGF